MSGNIKQSTPQPSQQLGDDGFKKGAWTAEVRPCRGRVPVIIGLHVYIDVGG
jgi:hypothetical protein